MRQYETYVMRRMMEINVDGWTGRGRPKKKFIECMRYDVKEKEVSKGRSGEMMIVMITFNC